MLEELSGDFEIFWLMRFKAKGGCICSVAYTHRILANAYPVKNKRVDRHPGKLSVPETSIVFRVQIFKNVA